MVSEQVAPGKPKVGVRERTAVTERAERSGGLRLEDASFGTLVGLLEIDSRGVHSPQDVLESSSHELAFECREMAGRRLEIRVAADLHGSFETLFQLPAPLRQLRLDGQMIGSVRQQDRVAAGALERRAEPVDDPLDPIARLLH